MATKKPRLKTFSKKNLNLSKLILAVRELADKYPDLVYEEPKGGKCQYKPSRQSDGDMLGCIVGMGLRKIGISLAGLDTKDDTSILGLLEEAGFDENDRQVAWLAEVQGAQDMDTSWGDAVTSADENAPLA